MTHDSAPWRQSGWAEHTQTLLDSFRRLLGRELLPREADLEEQARRLFEAEFVVVSHNVDADPILNYGNRAALNLWEMDLEALLRTPSRLTAEPMHRDERAQLLEQTRLHGYIDNYQGVRISSTGRRFLIRQAIVWNLQDASGVRVGQAATFSDWEFLPAR